MVVTILHTGQITTLDPDRAGFRGYWFFADDADLQTKRTLDLLTALRSSINAGGAQNIPILTLPVIR
jgi:hypothetical protein